MPTPFARLDVSDWRVIRIETVGQSPTTWLQEPSMGSSSDFHWIFKPAAIHSNGTRQGGDWSEKICSELARLLGIPSAFVELAVWNGQEGSISKNVRPNGYDMHSGRLWMNADPEVAYTSATSTKSKRVSGASPGYTIQNIETSLMGSGPPPTHSPTSQLSAFEVFAGYLLFDAIVANRDRHEDNWAVLEPTIGDEPARISPGYDYAGSLGYQLTDDKKSDLLEPGNRMKLVSWVNRGTAWRFDHGSAEMPTLVDLARQTFENLSDGAQSHWASKLGSLTSVNLATILDRLPQMSEVSRRFACEVILTNAGRITAWLPQP